MIKTELYFGLGNCGPGEFDAFLAQEVTPLFPDGLTVLEGRGQWKRRDTGEIEREPVAIGIFVRNDSARESLDLDSIREAFCSRFVQEAVMRLDSLVTASF